MIQLATEPTASRTSYRPTASEGKGSTVQPRRVRAHAWPFLSRAVGTTQQTEQKSAGRDSGS